MIRRRKPIERSKVPLKRTPIRRARPIQAEPGRPSMTGISGRSIKVEGRTAERVAVKAAAWDRDRGFCQARPRMIAAGWGGDLARCRGPMDSHEVIPRSAWHEGQYVLENVIVVCRWHHDWIGDHPHAAHALGLHGFSWERPS